MGDDILKQQSVRPTVVEPQNDAVRPLGMDRGKIWVADDFDAPLPDDLLKAFYGGELPKLEKSTREV
jgi:hypothetical protein